MENFISTTANWQGIYIYMKATQSAILLLYYKTACVRFLLDIPLFALSSSTLAIQRYICFDWNLLRTLLEQFYKKSILYDEYIKAFKNIYIKKMQFTGSNIILVTNTD